MKKEEFVENKNIQDNSSSEGSIGKKLKTKLPKMDPTIEEIRNKIKSAKMNKNISNDIKEITVDPNLKFDTFFEKKYCQKTLFEKKCNQKDEPTLKGLSPF